MKIEDAVGCWAFEPSLVNEADLVLCPDEDCSVFSPLSEWRESTVYCELCGDHSSMVCPVCEEHVDHVRSEVFVVVPAAG